MCRSSVSEITALAVPDPFGFERGWQAAEPVSQLANLDLKPLIDCRTRRAAFPKRRRVVWLRHRSPVPNKLRRVFATRLASVPVDTEARSGLMATPCRNRPSRVATVCRSDYVPVGMPRAPSEDRDGARRSRSQGPRRGDPCCTAGRVEPRSRGPPGRDVRRQAAPLSARREPARRRGWHDARAD